MISWPLEDPKEGIMVWQLYGTCRSKMFTSVSPHEILALGPERRPHILDLLKTTE